MLATVERVRAYGDTPDQLIWHKPAGRGAGDFQPIACSEEGIVFPWPKREVSLRLDKPNERWCADCLVMIRDKSATEQ
ncbi:hypothetical protein ABZ401_19535 [Streptomyces sp. NPDC005892]|uniref:hypothetical protein n=1 Tax=Streptomyces sp. NPDC005892 TaxID=3155593 RepID=UPI0033C2501F